MNEVTIRQSYEIARERYAALGVDTDAVCVKAKTNEKMGFVGAGEGVAVTAAVSIIRV